MVESAVAAHAGSDVRAVEQAERERRNARTEDRLCKGDDDARDGDHRPSRRHRDGDRRNGKSCQCRNQQTALVTRRIDRGADRNLDRYSGQATDHGDQADRRLVPLMLGQQKDPEDRTQHARRVGQTEVEPVEGEAATHGPLRAFRRRASGILAPGAWASCPRSPWVSVPCAACRPSASGYPSMFR